MDIILRVMTAKSFMCIMSQKPHMMLDKTQCLRLSRVVWLVPKLRLSLVIHKCCPRKASLAPCTPASLLIAPADYRQWPGFWHPCRNDGFPGLAGLVYKGDSGSLGTRATNRCLTRSKAEGRAKWQKASLTQRRNAKSNAKSNACRW